MFSIIDIFEPEIIKNIFVYFNLLSQQSCKIDNNELLFLTMYGNSSIAITNLLFIVLLYKYSKNELKLFK